MPSGFFLLPEETPTSSYYLEAELPYNLTPRQLKFTFWVGISKHQHCRSTLLFWVEDTGNVQPFEKIFNNYRILAKTKFKLDAFLL